MSDHDLTALLGSRICHDLISPVGAIGNGLELMGLSGLDTAPEYALVSESVRNANARIRLFRIAFGAWDREQTVGAAEIAGILRDAAESHRLEIGWMVSGPASRAEAKLALLLVMCAEMAMPWGGRVEIARADGRWTIEGRADKIKPDPDLWATLSRRENGIGVTAALIQFPLAFDLAGAIGRQIGADFGEGRLTITF